MHSNQEKTEYWSEAFGLLCVAQRGCTGDSGPWWLLEYLKSSQLESIQRAKGGAALPLSIPGKLALNHNMEKIEKDINIKH